MKQFFLSIAVLVLSLSTKNSPAQSANDIALNYSSALSALADNNSAAIAVTRVHIKAVRDFNRSHKNSPDAKWFRTDKGFSASFSSDGKNTKAVYDAKGNRQYEIISYIEQHLDAGIRKLVKSTYYDNTIIGVHQFEFENNKTVYVIKMLDQKSAPVTLTVCDGQVNDITSPSKN